MASPLDSSGQSASTAKLSPPAWLNEAIQNQKWAECDGKWTEPFLKLMSAVRDHEWDVVRIRLLTMDAWENEVTGEHLQFRDNKEPVKALFFLSISEAQ